jgi:hypothetical protein
MLLMAEAKLEHRGDNDVEKRQGIKEATEQEASKQSERMNSAGEKMKKDCSQSRLEHGRSERHHLVNWKTYKYDGPHWGRTSECNDVR